MNYRSTHNTKENKLEYVVCTSWYGVAGKKTMLFVLGVHFLIILLKSGSV